MVYCSFSHLFTFALRMVLNQPTNGVQSRKVHDVRVSLLAFSAKGLERPVPPQNAEYSMLLACVLPRACFNVYVNEIYESCTTLEVGDGAGEAAGEAWCCALRLCWGSGGFGSCCVC